MVVYKRIGLLIFLASGYFIAGKLGLKLAFVNESISAIWAPTGIALAAFLIFGNQIWPAIFVGAFFVNFSTTGEIISSLGIAIGNTLEAFVGAYLINEFASGLKAFNRVNDILKFVLFGALVAPMISASIGVTSLVLTNNASFADSNFIWFTWWLGDAVGAIVIAPTLILWFSNAYTKPSLNSRLILEWIVLLASLVLINFIIFGNVVPYLNFKSTGFLLIPFLVWSALRLSRKETTIVVLITTTIATWGTLHGYGPFVPNTTSINESLLFLQSFIAVVSLVSLILATVVTENKLKEKTLAEAYDMALEGWSKALDLRDKETHGHAMRVADLSVKLAKELNLNDSDVTNIKRGALLHDIGKMAIPDNILFKKGSLTEDEWMIMRKHSAWGADLLEHMTCFSEAKNIPLYHHEKWDGTGYPHGLKGTDIPLPARVFTVVDVWDALRSDRSYRSALSDQEVLEYMRSLSGTHFDPKILKTFIDLMEG